MSSLSPFAIPDSSCKQEMELTSSKYHLVGAWIAIIFDPLFAITDYFNIPAHWLPILYIRLGVSLLTFTSLQLQKRFNLPSYMVVLVPFALISLQNAYTFSVITNEHLIGHNLNFIALLIGAAMFVAWDLTYSLSVLLVSAIATGFFISINPSISFGEFFVKGGLLLIAAGVFMLVLIKTRYDLTMKEIKARLALQLSNEEVQAQNEELQAQEDIIRGINENLENLVNKRTAELEKKNKALEEYAFINAHKLRSPVASILGLIILLNKIELNDEGRTVMTHLKESADKLDSIVRSITKAIERGDD